MSTNNAVGVRPVERVVVIGAGMVGLSTAWFLQRSGVDVTVVDRHQVAAGSSWGNAGWLSPALTMPLNDPGILSTGIRQVLRPASPVYVPFTLNPRLLLFLADFARHCTPRHWRSALNAFVIANRSAHDAYDELTASVDCPIEAPIKEATPLLAAFVCEKDRESLVEEFHRVEEVGYGTEYTLLDRDQVHGLEPALGPAVNCGISMTGQRFINPGEFVQALARAVKTGGGKVLTGREATGVTQVGQSAAVRFDDGTRVDTDAIVIATGTWVSALARRHGVRRLVQAGRGYSFTVHPEVAPVNPLYLHGQRVACTPLGEPEDGLRVAGMMEFRAPEHPLDHRRIRAIIAAAAPMITGVDWSARTDEWVGSRPCTADGLPLVGRTSSNSIYVASGHGMWGIALGPLTGRLLADQIVRGHTDPLLRSFNPLR